MSELQDYLATDPPLLETVVGYLVKDNEVLLGVRTRVSDGLGHLIVSGIGGRLEEGESAEDALVREVLEEIEVVVTDFKKVGHVVCLSPHRPLWNLSVAYYVVTSFEGEPKKTEDIDPYWYPKNKLPLSDMWLDNQITVPLVLNDKRIAGSFLYGANGQIVEHDLRVLDIHETIPNSLNDFTEE